GWYKGATQLFIDVVKEIEKYDPGKTKSVWLTGHSLGGAVAALLAAELALRNRAYKVFNGVYTYGQPRVADPSTAKAFDKRWPSKFFRIVNKGDDACDFPFVGDKYKHFGEPHIFDTTGTVPNFFSHLLQLEFNQMMAQTTSHHPLRYLTALKQ
ncbi:MAG: hypothetical protein HRT35_32485, partial [Algicola sp.]|nr:hypothetical protein [Algicola sp.]